MLSEMCQYKFIMKADIILLSCLLFLNISNIIAQEKSGRIKDSDLPEPRIVILGSAGVGKSTLANVLLDCAPNDDCTFQVCDGIEACTKETSYGVGNWAGAGPAFTVVDTPGFGYADNDDSELIDEMTKFLQNEVNTTDVFLLTLHGQQDKIDKTLQQMIRELAMLFGNQFWSNVVLEFTHWPFDAHSCSVRNISGRTEAWKIETVNQGLKEMFDVDVALPGVFVDSFSQHEINIDDQDQQAAFQRETAKLFDFMVEYEPFQFLTIEDVLKELFALRQEIDHLNRFIEDDLLEVKQDIESVRLDVNHNGDLISRNEGLISRNEGLISRNEIKIDKVANESQTSTEMLEEKIQNQLNGLIIDLNQELEAFTKTILPIGSIVAWSGQPITNADLPQGWQLCDGSKITEGPMMNLFTPDLNGKRRFLRGGSEFSEWSYQDHMLPIHQHRLSDPGHKHVDAGHHHSYRRTVASATNQGYWFDDADDAEYELQSTETGYANIQHSETGISIGDPTNTTVPLGDEVRPKNMAVQWIIKIY